jgi:hypothetical protein
MDIDAALEEVARWCAQQTAAGDPDAVEIECHAAVSITIGESAPPWRVRFARRDSSGASGPVAQLRYDLKSRDWTLHDCAPPRGWSDVDDAVRARDLGALLDVVANDREGRFIGLPPGVIDSARWHA